jgi:F0F1-type ATP synthase assembly protein I
MSSEQKPAGKGDRGKEQRSTLESLREYTPYLTLGFQLAATVVVFFLIGEWADRRWDASPWFKLTGLFLGTVGGFVKFFRTIANLDRKNKDTPGKSSL